LRRSLRSVTRVDESRPWMRYAGMVETGDSRRYDRTRALQFLAMVEDMTPLGILPVGAAEHAAGVDVLRRFSDQDLTLTDGVGLHIMKRHKIKRCGSTLGLTGVPLVIDQS
jgi:hypothetical protein